MDSEPGLRERKKQRTRETIARVALALFAERGYDATTLPEIARTADVSTRTIFAYFPSKEDILFHEIAALRDALAEVLRVRPGGKDALGTVRDFIVAVPHAHADDVGGRRARLLEQNETLRTHLRARMAQLEELVAAAIADDLGVPPGELRPRIAAASLIAALESLDRDETSPSCPEDGGASVIDPVITFLRAGLDGLAPAAERTRRG